MTESEQLFEDFCASLNIRFERVETGKEQTPDYRIWPWDTEVVCEVKQIELNDLERKALAAASRGEYIVTGGTPGARVRGKITDASPQLRQLAKGHCPALLVLSEESLVPRHLDAYHIRVAMYGLDTIVLGVRRDSAIRPYVRDRKSGPKRKMNLEHNTSISAILELRKRGDGNMQANMYHNRFAAIPLNKELMVADQLRHFRLREKVEGEFEYWEQI